MSNLNTVILIVGLAMAVAIVAFACIRRPPYFEPPYQPSEREQGREYASDLLDDADDAEVCARHLSNTAHTFGLGQMGMCEFDKGVLDEIHARGLLQPKDQPPTSGPPPAVPPLEVTPGPGWRA